MGRNKNKNINFLNRKLDVNDLYEILGTKNSDEIISVIFEWIENEIKNYNNIKNSKKMHRGLNLIVELAENDKNVDKIKIQIKLKNLYNKIEDKFIKNKDKYKTKDLKKIKHTINELSNMFDAFGEDSESKKYKFLEYIIFETKNYYYLKNTLIYFPAVVNTKDENGKSLVYNVIFTLLDLIQENELTEDLYYYDKVIDIILSNNNFIFNEEEKIECLSQLYNTLLRLEQKEKLFNVKKNLLLNLKDELSNSKKTDKSTITILKRKYNIKESFSRKVLEQLEPDKAYQASVPKRIVNDYIISIDGPNAIEIDDALSAVKLKNGNYLLGVHTASVTSYFDYNSLIVQNAIERGENIYCGKDLITIFPKEYSANKGSLLQNVPRFAESHYFEIARDGEIVRDWITKSVITNYNQTTYKRVGQAITSGCRNKALEMTVNNLVDITKIIAKRYNSEVYIDGKNNEHLANDIVMFTTLLHNESVANFFHKNNYPMLYKVQDKTNTPDNKMEEMLRDFSGCYLSKDYRSVENIITNYSESIYATSGAHKGLNIEHYTQCSSALRRGADIIVQRGLDLFYYNLFDDRQRYIFEDQLEERVKKLNQQKDNIKRFIQKSKPKSRGR